MRLPDHDGKWRASDTRHPVGGDRHGRSGDLYERIVEAFNRHDLGAIGDLCTPDCVIVRPSFGAYQGWPAATEWFTTFWKAFPDCAVTVTRHVEQGDELAALLIWTGTHSGPLPLPDGSDLPPSGRRVEGLLADFVSLREGKAARSELYEGNALEVAAQLGVLPQG